MSLIHHYLDRMQREGLSILDMQQELSATLKTINKKWDCDTFVYAAAEGKEAPGLALNPDDFQVIEDMLRDVKNDRILFYLQTPGGDGPTAERIAKFLHKKFKEVYFIIAGNAMSAGTILALSGHEIMMTDGGSLGPIDAQMRIGRSTCSAHDYITWIENLRDEVNKNGGVHAVDATVLAQISPGELEGVHTALDFAVTRVEKWLAEHKFKDWTETDTRKIPVTDEMRQKRAHEIAEQLTNQQKWKSHGTRLSIQDLEELGLKVKRVEDYDIADAVAKIKAIIWVIFSNSSAFKLFADPERRIQRNAAQGPPPGPTPPDPRNAEMMEVVVPCPQCKRQHTFFARFVDNETSRKHLADTLHPPLPKGDKLTCDCGFVIDLKGQRAHIENMTGKRIIDDQPKGGKNG